MTQEVMRDIFARIRADRGFRQQLFAAPRAMLAGYDLTEDERLRLMLPNFTWVLPDRLAGSARPASPDALEALRLRGVRALVSLTEDPLPFDRVRAAGMESVHLPVADFTAPTLEQIRAAVAAIAGFLGRGRPVAVHCAAGLGRTGTILACYQVSQGATVEDAITAIRTRRPGSIETPEQEAAIQGYAESLR